jgi:GTPase involved in cell partitioning and DNA repair
MSQEDAFSNLQSLKFELEQYRPGLSKRMSGIIANKMDLPSAKQNILGFVEDLNNQYQGMPFKLFHKRVLVIYYTERGCCFD